MRKTPAYWIVVILLSLITSSVVYAQLSYTPPSFAPKQSISSSTFNSLFATIDSEALNRTDGVMIGDITWSSDGGGSIGALGASRPADIHVQDDVFVGDALSVTGAATLSSTLAVNSTSASAVDVAGGITAGSGNVGIIGTDGRIPALSSTYLASLSGANLTGLLEANIADGTIFPRIAAVEQITGQWNFNLGASFGTVAAPFASHLTLALNSGGSNYIGVTDGTKQGIFGTDNTAATVQVGSFTNHPFIVRTNNVNRTTWGTDGTLTHAGAVVISGKISPTALSADANNYNPSGLSTTRTVRLITNNTSTRNITGITAQVDGFELRICNIGVSGVNGSITFTQEDVNSSAANRFAFPGSIAQGECKPLSYDGTSSRWRSDS